VPPLTANTLATLPVASYAPVPQSGQPMTLGESHPQLMLARVGLFGRTYLIGIIRTTYKRIGPVHPLNRASYERAQEDICCFRRGRNACSVARRDARKRTAWRPLRRRGPGPLLCARPIRSRSRAIRRFWQLRMGDTAFL
jgi:hypothetical protein